MALAKTTVRLEQGNRERLAKVQRVIARLPKAERPLWIARVKRKLAEGPRVVVGGEWGTTTPTDAPSEWDLEVANYLGGIYDAVSDRVEEVWEKGKTGLGKAVREGGDAVKDAGFGLWPLAIAAVAVFMAFGSAKRAR